MSLETSSKKGSLISISLGTYTQYIIISRGVHPKCLSQRLYKGIHHLNIPWDILEEGINHVRCRQWLDRCGSWVETGPALLSTNGGESLVCSFLSGLLSADGGSRMYNYLGALKHSQIQKL